MLKSYRLIVDDNYEHALRIIQEEETQVIRLQASVQTGALKRKPIWTAFITDQILSPAWASCDSPGVVHLVYLQQYIFTADYTPRKMPTGAFDLIFTVVRGIAPFLVYFINVLIGSDAEEFMEAIEELRNTEISQRNTTLEGSDHE